MQPTLHIPNAQTNVTTYVVLRDSTNHAPATGVTITDIDLYYVEELAAISSKVDATALAAADSAHADNKAFEIGQGVYRIDWPDAAFDGGIGKKVVLIVVCAAIDTVFLPVELSPAADLRAVDGVALINHPAGMMPSSDVLLTGTAAAGSSTTITLSGGVATNGLYNGCLVIITSGTGAGQSRTILSYIGATTVATVTRNWINAPDATSKFVVLGSDVPEMLDSGTAAAGAANSITLHAGASAINDTYNDNVVFISSGTGSGQSRQISDYDGTSKVASVTPVWFTPPDATSAYQIVPQGRVDLGRWLGTIPLALSTQFVQAVLTDKVGFKLASDGLDTVAVTEPAGPAANFREMIVQLWRRLFKKATMTSSQLVTYADDGTTPVTTQALSDDATTQTQGAAT